MSYHTHVLFFQKKVISHVVLISRSCFLSIHCIIQPIYRKFTVPKYCFIFACTNAATSLSLTQTHQKRKPTKQQTPPDYYLDVGIPDSSEDESWAGWPVLDGPKCFLNNCSPLSLKFRWPTNSSPNPKTSSPTDLQIKPSQPSPKTLTQ